MSETKQQRFTAYCAFCGRQKQERTKKAINRWATDHLGCDRPKVTIVDREAGRDVVSTTDSDLIARGDSDWSCAMYVDRAPGPVYFWHADLPEIKTYPTESEAAYYGVGVAHCRRSVAVRRAAAPQIDLDLIDLPTYAMQSWLIAEGLLKPIQASHTSTQETRRLIREYFPGGVDAFLRSHASNQKKGA